MADSWNTKIGIRHTGKEIVATTLTGNPNVPAGEVEFYGSFDANPFVGHQICSGPNFSNPRWLKVSIQVLDAGHLSEELVDSGCMGFPVLWRKVGNSNPH